MNFVINTASICPIFLIFLSLLQSSLFFSSARSASKGDFFFDTSFNYTQAFSSGFSSKEYENFFTLQGKLQLYMLPIYAIFVFFFSTVFKLVIPILIYVLSFNIAKFVFIAIRNKQKREKDKNEE